MESPNKPSPPTPANIMRIGTGFWASKVLLAAVKFELFTILSEKKAMSATELKSVLNLKCSDRHAYDWLDTMVAFGFLHREGLLDNARYSNSEDTNIFLDKRKPSYIGGLLEMLNNRLYRFWGDLENGLLTGHPQNEIKGGEEHLFATLYEDPQRLEEFIMAMSGIQMGNFIAFANKFDFSRYKTLTDAGGAAALLSVTVARHHPHMKCISFDLPPVQPIAESTIRKGGLSDRVKTANGDFFKDPLPKAEVIVMGNILHDWDEKQKQALVKKAFDALPEGGAFVAIENIIDEERKENVFGLMMSLNMLIETGSGFDYMFSDFTKWAKAAGFKNTTLLPLAGPSSAAIAIK